MELGFCSWSCFMVMKRCESQKEEKTALRISSDWMRLNFLFSLMRVHFSSQTAIIIVFVIFYLASLQPLSFSRSQSCGKKTIQFFCLCQITKLKKWDFILFERIFRMKKHFYWIWRQFVIRNVNISSNSVASSPKSLKPLQNKATEVDKKFPQNIRWEKKVAVKSV